MIQDADLAAAKLAHEFVATINGRMGKDSDWNLSDMSDQEKLTYNAALGLLSKVFEVNARPEAWA